MAADRRTTVRLVEAMPELLDGLERFDQRVARHYLVAELLHVPRGSWIPPEEIQGGPGHLGLLVVDGLLTRNVILERPLATELVGHGDLLRPADRDGPEAPIPFDVSWRVLQPARIAILDPEVSRVAGRWPSVIECIVKGASNRAHSLAISLAVSHLRRIDHRLLVMLWYMADRWGRVRPDGVLVPLRLTHDVLAQLVGAQRPSVTLALRNLTEMGRVVKTPDRCWLLTGDPPTELAGVTPRPGAPSAGRR